MTNPDEMTREMMRSAANAVALVWSGDMMPSRRTTLLMARLTQTMMPRKIRKVPAARCSPTMK
jgi:hypothetical protein